MSSWRRSGQGRQAKFNDAFSVDQDQASSSSSALPNNNNNNDYDPDQMAAYSITQLAQQASEESLNLLQHHQQEGQGDNSQQSEQEQQEALPHSNSHTEQPTADQVQFWNQHHHDEHEREVEQQTQLQNDDQPPPAKKAKKALDRKAQNREAQRTFRQKRDVYIKELEVKAKELDTIRTTAGLSGSQYPLYYHQALEQIDALRNENSLLKSHLSRHGLSLPAGVEQDNEENADFHPGEGDRGERGQD